MLPEISAALQATKILYDIAKANKELTNYNEFVAAVSEVNAKLIDANAAALTSQEKQSLLSDRVRELEKRLMEFENWESEIQKYKLHKFPSGTFAFELKPEMQQADPLHYLCEACAAKRQKSIMQPDGFHDGKPLFLRCHNCNLLIPTITMSPALENSLRTRMKL
jgi:hypothetical protein